MTNKRDENKVHVGCYVTKEEKEKMDQLKYELGGISTTDLIRFLIKEQEVYGRYHPEDTKGTKDTMESKDVD